MNKQLIFTYDENISDKGIEPLLGEDNTNNYTDKNKISNYFYYLKEDEIKELDKIYNHSTKVSKNNLKETINKDSWLKYKIASNITIPPLSETIKKSQIKTNDDNSINVKYGNNGKYINLIFDNEENYSQKTKMNHTSLFELKKEDFIVEKNLLFLHKEGIYKSDLEFLYMTLNCLFSSNNTYYIKKCERCGGFYLANKINKKFCYRPTIICGKLTSCHHALEQLYQSKEYRAIIRKKEKHLDKYYKRNDEESWNYINNFLTALYNILENCKNNLDITNDDLEKINKLFI